MLRKLRLLLQQAGTTIMKWLNVTVMQITATCLLQAVKDTLIVQAADDLGIEDVEDFEAELAALNQAQPKH